MKDRRPAAGINPLLPAGAAATAIYVLFTGLPLLGLVIAAVSGERFPGSLGSASVLQAVRLSAFTTSVSLAVSVLIGTPLAYVLARHRHPALQVVDVLVELPIVLPPVVAGVALLMAFGRRGLLGPALEGAGVAIPFTTLAVIMAEVFVSAPFYIRSARLGFQAVGRQYEDVSLTLGLSPWRTFWKLWVPMASPSLLGGMALAWARALSEFGATIMFAGSLAGRTQTVPLAVMDAMESDIPAALALSVLAVLAASVVLAAVRMASGLAAPPARP